MTQISNNRASTGVHIATNAIHVAHAPAPDATLADMQVNSIPIQSDDNQSESPNAHVNQALSLVRKLPEAKAKNIIVTTPDNQFQYHSFRLTKMPESEIANAVHWKIAQETSTPPTDYKSDYFNVGALKVGDETKLEMVGMCVNQSDLIDLVNQYEANGWYVSAIDSPIAARVRGLHLLTPTLNTTEPQLILNLQRDSTQLIISIDGDIHFYKSSRTGFDQLISALVRQYKTTYSKAIPIFNALNLHPDLITNIDQWHEAFPPRPEVDDVINHATNEYLTNLSQELKLCLQHIRKAHPHLIPSQFIAIGLGATNQVINTLTEQFELNHHNCTIPPQLSAQFQTKQIIGINRCSQLATVIGLATYDRRISSKRRSA